MSEMSIHDLEAQSTEMLPEREALGLIALGSFNNHVIAINNAEAVQAVTLLSKNTAIAAQTVVVG
jgi:hypothetical protein